MDEEVHFSRAHSQGGEAQIPVVVVVEVEVGVVVSSSSCRSIDSSSSQW